MLRYWLAAAYLFDVLRLVLRLVAVLSGLLCLPLAVLFSCLPLAMILSCLLLALLFCLQLSLLVSVLFIIAPGLRCFLLLAVLVPLLLYFILLTTGSLVSSRILTTGSLAVRMACGSTRSFCGRARCLFFRVTLWQVTTSWLVSGFPPPSPLSIAPFVIEGSR